MSGGYFNDWRTFILGLSTVDHVHFFDMTIDLIERFCTNERRSYLLCHDTTLACLLYFHTFMLHFNLELYLLQAGYICSPDTSIKVKLFAFQARKTLRLIIIYSIYSDYRHCSILIGIVFQENDVIFLSLLDERLDFIPLLSMIVIRSYLVFELGTLWCLLLLTDHFFDELFLLSLHLLLEDVDARVVVIQFVARLVRVFMYKFHHCAPIYFILICMLLVEI